MINICYNCISKLKIQSFALVELKIHISCKLPTNDLNGHERTIWGIV